MPSERLRQTDLSLNEVDEDDAILEAIERVQGDTRAGFLRNATIGGAALLGAFALPGAANAQSAKDVDILNYALSLEYLQAAFYTEAEQVRALRGKARRAVEVVGAVERAHVKAFQDALGAAAIARPTFNFRGVTESQTQFLKTAVAFEDLAVAAYKGQAPRLVSDALLAVAVSIHSVEARHAAWMRYLFNITPAANAFDEPLSRQEVTKIVASTNFVTAPGRTERKGTPRFTG